MVNSTNFNRQIRFELRMTVGADVPILGNANLVERSRKMTQRLFLVSCRQHGRELDVEAEVTFL